MSTPVWRRALLLVLLALLGGCSMGVKVAYNNADALLLWRLKRYVDLEPPQSQALQASVARLHAWHRAQELPRAVALLHDAEASASDGLTSDEAYRLFGEARGRYQVLADAVAQEGSAVLASLTAQQRETLRRRLAEDDQRFAAEFVKVDDAKLRQQRAQRVLEHVQRLYGDLRAEQRELVLTASKAMPLTYADRLEHHARRQAELLQLLERYPNADSLRPALRRWLADWESSRTPAHAQRARQILDQSVQMLVDLDRTLTAAQRRTLLVRLERYASDVSALAVQRPGGLVAASVLQ
jgi:hypothetical protein